MTGYWNEPTDEVERVAVTWLSDMRRTRREVRAKMDELAELRAMMDGISAVVYDRIGGAGSADHGDDAMFARLERADALTATYTAALDEARARLDSSERLLSSLPPLHAALLRHRYVDAMVWREVAAMLGVGETRCYAMRRPALEMLYDKLIAP